MVAVREDVAGRGRNRRVITRAPHVTTFYCAHATVVDGTLVNRVATVAAVVSLTAVYKLRIFRRKKYYN